MSGKQQTVAVALVLGLIVGFAYWQGRRTQRAEAARAVADSTAAAYADSAAVTRVRLDSLAAVSDALRDSMEAGRQELEVVAAAAGRATRRARELVSTPLIADTVRVVVAAALDTLEAEVAACVSVLTVCELRVHADSVRLAGERDLRLQAEVALAAQRRALAVARPWPAWRKGAVLASGALLGYGAAKEEGLVLLTGVIGTVVFGLVLP